MRRIRVTQTFRATSDDFNNTSDVRTYEAGTEYDVPDDIYKAAVIDKQCAETVVKAHSGAPLNKSVAPPVDETPDEAPKPTRRRRKRA